MLFNKYVFTWILIYKLDSSRKKIRSYPIKIKLKTVGNASTFEYLYL